MKMSFLISCFLIVVLLIVLCFSVTYQPMGISSKETESVGEKDSKSTPAADDINTTLVPLKIDDLIEFKPETQLAMHQITTITCNLSNVANSEIFLRNNRNGLSTLPDVVAGSGDGKEKEFHKTKLPRLLTDQESEELYAFGWTSQVGENTSIWVNVDNQTFHIIKKDNVLWEMPCSTARKGTGSKMNSNKTPLGWHRIVEKYGKDAQWGTVFSNTHQTTRIWERDEASQEDLILTRVLVLDGIEQGKNKGNNVDSYTRGIYIHGTNDEKNIGTPISHGCIRLKNDDVIEVFDRIPLATLVLITQRHANGEPQVDINAPSALDEIAAQFDGKEPKEWGLCVSGVKTHFECHSKQIALTLDACMGKCDYEIIDVLKDEKVPATFFIAGPWLEAHPEIVQELSRNPLFELENHGHTHRPLSVDGRSAYGIQGTKSPLEVIDEIAINANELEAAIGYRPRFFRAGTAHCDELAVRIANELATTIVNFNINGDEGGTLTNDKLYTSLTKKTTPGSIIIMHINRPRKGASAALRKAIKHLRSQGFEFVKIQDCGLDK